MDIDRLLVMTFTNAAAAEMRERVETALGSLLDEDPGNKNLERQSTLIHHAKITTIDSFCLNLLREHFHELDLDPGFRVADEGELLLLKADVMKELLEEYYGREDERFLQFVDTYASGRTDGGLEDYILKVWEFHRVIRGRESGSPPAGTSFRRAVRKVPGEKAERNRTG